MREGAAHQSSRQNERPMPLIVRLAIVGDVAAAMAVIGLVLFKWTHSLSVPLPAYIYFIVVSVVLWLPLSLMVRRASLSVTVGIGILSPFIGSLCFCQPFSVLVIPVSPLTLPVGLVTAILVKVAICSDAIVEYVRSRRGECPMCAYDLRGSERQVCSECGYRLIDFRFRLTKSEQPLALPIVVATLLVVTTIVLMLIRARLASVPPSPHPLRIVGASPVALISGTAAALMANAVWIMISLLRRKPRAGPDRSSSAPNAGRQFRVAR